MKLRFQPAGEPHSVKGITFLPQGEILLQPQVEWLSFKVACVAGMCERTSKKIMGPRHWRGGEYHDAGLRVEFGSSRIPCFLIVSDIPRRIPRGENCQTSHIALGIWKSRVM